MPPLFIALIATLGLLSGELEAALYLSVTAFALTAAVAALKSQEENTTKKLKDAIPEYGQNDPRIIKLLEQPARWSLYSVILFVVSGFAFLAFYLTPSETLGPEEFPSFIGVVYLYGLAFCYFLILFTFTVFPKSRRVFKAAQSLGFAMRAGAIGGLIMWTVSFELIPAFLLVATFVGAFTSGLVGGVTTELLILDALTVPSLVGCMAIVWASADLLRRKSRRFNNRQLGVAVIAYLLPLLSTLILLLPKWV